MPTALASPTSAATPAPKAPDVTFVRDEVRELIDKWQMIRDCLDGSFAVKAKRDLYLAMPNASDQSAENKDRFEMRLKRAVFYNVTARTHKGLVGQVFAKDPSTELPATLEPFIADVDGSGIALDQQSKKALATILAHGTAGLLVDYPSKTSPDDAPAVTTRAELLSGNVRPTLCLYEPWNITNWRTKVIGSKVVLSLVVLLESYLSEDDGFKPEFAVQYRVLRLEEETNDYTVAIWRKSDDGWFEFSKFAVTDAKGQPMKEIPFVPIGAESNELMTSLPPLLDMALLNLAHYNNSADNEDSIWMVGAPTFVFSGLTSNWVNDIMKGGVRIGASSGVLLPVGGGAEILQADPNTLAKEGMEHKEKQMKALGAKLVEDKAVQRTATEAGMDEASETSVLTSAAVNVSTAYTAALRFAAAFLGETNVSDAVLAYELNTDLAITRLDPQAQAQVIAGWQGGAYTWHEMRWNLRRGGVVYEDDDKAKELIEAEVGASAIGAAPKLDPNKPDPEEDDEEEEEEEPFA